MTMKHILLAGAAALALSACGGKDEGASAPKTEAAAKAAKADAKSPLELSYRLKDGEALDVDALFGLFPADARPTYESAAFDEQLGATVVTNLKIADANDSDAFMIERAELYGVDLDAIAAVRDVSKAAVDAPFKDIFTKVRLFGVSPVSDDEDAPEMSIGAIEIDALRIREGGVDEDSEVSEGAQFFNAFELGGLYIKDMIVSTGAEDAETTDSAEAGAEDSGDEEGAAPPPPPQIDIRAPDLRFVGIGGGKVNAIIGNDLGYEVSQSSETIAAIGEAMGPQGAILMGGPLRNLVAPENQRVTMESFEWRGIDLSGLMEYGLKNEKPPLTAKNLINLGTMKLVNTETYVGDKLLASAPLTDVTAMEFTWLIPSKIRATSKDATYDFTAYTTEADDQALAVLKENGLDDVKANSDFNWDWDAKKGSADFFTDFDAPQLADFALSFSMGGLELDKINTAMEAGDQNAIEKSATFKNFSMTLRDEKLLDTIYDIAALQMGGGEGADLRTSTPAMLRLSTAQFAQMNERFPAYIDAIATFLGEGGTLTIEASPEQPVSLTAIDAAGNAGPQALPELLDLTITHKK